MQGENEGGGRLLDTRLGAHPQKPWADLAEALLPWDLEPPRFLEKLLPRVDLD